MQRIKIESTTSDNVPFICFVVKPTHKDYAQAKLVSAQAFREAVESKAFFRKKLDSVMREQGLWSDAEEQRLRELIVGIQENLDKLSHGGIELEEARQIALKVRQLRAEEVLLLSSIRENDSYTVEGQAENAHFDFLVSVCTVDEEGKRVYDNLEDYRAKADEPYSHMSAQELSSLIYGLGTDWQKELPENQFLAEFGFIDDKLRLIDKNGHLISLDGKLIDEDGNYVDDKGNRVNYQGNRINDDGSVVIDRKPFLQNGQPIARETKKAATKKVAATKTR